MSLFGVGPKLTLAVSLDLDPSKLKNPHPRRGGRKCNLIRKLFVERATDQRRASRHGSRACKTGPIVSFVKKLLRTRRLEPD
jgi:hypothetical protein